MSLNIPLDLPDQSFVEQLSWLETWACLPKGTLTNAKQQLAAVAQYGADKMVPVILDCVRRKIWDWPAYDVYINAGGFTYSGDRLTDMAEQVYQKYRTNKMSHYRKSQIDHVKEFRPYWEFSGRCASPECDDDNALFILAHDDDYWLTARLPWRCDRLDCRCRVDSLSEFEYRNM